MVQVQVRQNKRPRLYGIAIIGALILLAFWLRQTSADDVEGVFVILSPHDTTAIEQYRRLPQGLEIELVNRENLRRSWIRAAVDAHDVIVRLELTVYRLGAPSGAQPLESLILKVEGDTTIIESRQGSDTWSMSKFDGGADLHPYLDASVALLGAATKHARRRSLDTLSLLEIGTATPKGDLAQVVIQNDSVAIVLPDWQLRAAIDDNGNIRGGTIPSQSLRVEHAFEPYRPRRADPEPVYEVPSNKSYTGEEVRIRTADGNVLAGTLTKPKAGKTTFPAVVLISGSGPQDRNSAEPAVPNGYQGFRQIAETLSARGIAVLRLDDRGVGVSTGDPAATTSEVYAGDIHSVVTFLRLRPDIDRNCIALLGHSEGGSTATMVAAEDSALRAAVLLAAPARPGKAVLIEQYQWLVAHDSMLVGPQQDSALAVALADLDIERQAARVREAVIRSLKAALSPGMSDSELDSIIRETETGTDFAAVAMGASKRFFLQYDPLPSARKVRVPVLVLHGENDRQISVGQAAELAAALREGGNKNVSVRIFRGVNHLFLADSIGDPRQYRRLPSQRIRADVLGTIADWLVYQLNSPQRRS